MKFNIDVSAHEILEFIRPRLPRDLSISSMDMEGDNVKIVVDVKKKIILLPCSLKFNVAFELKRTDNGKSLAFKLVSLSWIKLVGGITTKVAKDLLSKALSNLRIPGVNYSQSEACLKVTFAELQIPKNIAFVASGTLSNLTLNNGVLSMCYEVGAMKIHHWYDNAVFYHIYPFGELKDRNAVMRLDDMRRTLVPYLHGMGFTAVYLGPVWKSSSHGYDTIDYLTVDERLGKNDDLYWFVKSCHDCGIRVILDAVFNHVGPEFHVKPEFPVVYRDVVEKKESSPYWQWFRSVRRHRPNVVDTMLSWFGRPIPPEVTVGCWPKSKDLFELNLNSPEVVNCLYDVVCKWIDWFRIDGLRLDAADADGFPIEFLQGLRKVTSEKDKEFYLVGELTAPRVDYLERCGEGKCDGALNYRAMGDIVKSLQEQTLRHYATCMDYEFGNDGRYKELSLYGFLENHDTDRVASRLSKLDLHLAYALMFVSPGAPSVFYGGEWGATGRKQDRSALRVYSCADLASGNIPNADEKSIAEDIKRLIKCCAENPELRSSFFRLLKFEVDGNASSEKDIMVFRRSENMLCVASRLDKKSKCVIHGCLDGVYKDVLNSDTEEVRSLNGDLQIFSFPGWVRVLRKIA